MAFFRRERGQAGIEYLLVVGTIVVAMVGGFHVLMPQVVNAVAGSLACSVDPLGAVGCP